jgi:DNA-binding NarL/FixJ family response regulator
VRILLVDDHLLFSKGLQFLLADLDVHAECFIVSSIAQAVTYPGPLDLVLLDYSLPDSHGNLGLQRVRAAHEGVPVVMLSGETRLALVSDLIEQGAAGFISKSADTEVLLAALRTVLNGGIYLPRQILSVPSPATAAELSNLSPRQVQVVIKLMQGKSNKLIASELQLSDNTVKSHLAAAFRTLGVSNRTEAVFKAASLGLMPPPAGTQYQPD